MATSETDALALLEARRRKVEKEAALSAATLRAVSDVRDGMGIIEASRNRGVDAGRVRAALKKGSEP